MAGAREKMRRLSETVRYELSLLLLWSIAVNNDLSAADAANINDDDDAGTV